MRKSVIILAVMLMLLAACGKKESELRMGIIGPSIDHLPYSFAIKQGRMADLPVKTVEFTTGWEISEALAAGRIDAAIIPFTFVHNAVTKGFPVKTVSFFERETDGIVSKTRISDPNALKGAKVGILKASTLDVLWQDYASTNDINAERVYFRSPSEVIAALQSDEIDAAVLFVPLIGKLGEGYHVLHWFSERYPEHPCCDLAVNTKRIKGARQKTLLKMYEVLENTVDALPKDMDKVLAFAGERFGITQQQAHEALEHTGFMMGLDTAGKNFQALMSIYSIESGYMSRMPKDEELYWNIRE